MTRTQLAILWGLGVLIVIILGTLGWVISQAGPSSILPATSASAEGPTSVEAAAATTYRLPETPYSARHQYRQAEESARNWQPDAALVSAAASWSFASLDDFSRPVDWTFQFYSRSTGRLYVINVNQAEITPIRETIPPYPLPTIALDEWQVDSYEALNTWLNRGGGRLIKSYPVVDVSIRLARIQEGGPRWTILGIDGSGQNTWTERIDARGTS